MNRSYDHIYGAGIGHRRYPSEDVVRCLAGCKALETVADLATGTGRNLAPLLLAVRPGGLVVATEAAPSGLKVVEDWCRALGATRITHVNDVEERAGATLARAGIDWRRHAVFRVPIDFRYKNLGPAALFRGSEHVLLALCLSDMSKPVFPSGSLDFILNRGSVFYLDEAGIRATLGLMKDALSDEGQLLVTFKSTRDSRFMSGEPVEGAPWRRRITSGDQKGLEMEFFDEPRLRSFLDAEFRLRRLFHLEEVDTTNSAVFADWSVTAERAR